MIEPALWRKINEIFFGGGFVSSGRYGTQKYQRSKIAQIKASSVSECRQRWPTSVLEDETSSWQRRGKKKKKEREGMQSWFVPVCISKAKIWTNMRGNHQWAIINTQAVTSAPLPQSKNVVLRALWSLVGLGGSLLRDVDAAIFFCYHRALWAGKDSKPKENKQDDTLFP